MECGDEEGEEKEKEVGVHEDALHLVQVLVSET